MAYGFNEDRSKVDVYTEAEIDAKLAQETAVDQQLQGNIDAVNNRVNNIITNELAPSRKLLWQGDPSDPFYQSGVSKTFPNGGNANDYDYLQVEINLYHIGAVTPFELDSMFVEIPVTGGHLLYTNSNTSGTNPTVAQMESSNADLYVNGTSMYIKDSAVDSNSVYVSGTINSNPTIGEDAAYKIAILAVYGIKASSVGDDEIIDIRTGYDGTVYPSAGDAVRGQVEDVNNGVNALGFPKDLFTLADPFILGYDNENGEHSYNWHFIQSDFIPVHEGATYTYDDSTIRLFVLWYDSSKQFLSKDASNVYPHVAPQNAAFAKFVADLSKVNNQGGFGIRSDDERDLETVYTDNVYEPKELFEIGIVDQYHPAGLSSAFYQSIPLQSDNRWYVYNANGHVKTSTPIKIDENSYYQLSDNCLFACLFNLNDKIECENSQYCYHFDNNMLVYYDYKIGISKDVVNWGFTHMIAVFDCTSISECSITKYSKNALNTKLLNGIIDKSQMSVVKCSDILYKYGFTAGSYINENNVVTTNKNLTQSEFIPIVPGKTYGINFDGAFTLTFDQNKDFIYKVPSAFQSFIAEEDMRYMKILMLTSNVATAEFYTDDENLLHVSQSDLPDRDNAIRDVYKNLTGVAFGTSLTYREQTTGGYLSTLKVLSGINFVNEGEGSSGFVHNGNQGHSIKYHIENYANYATTDIVLIEGDVNDWWTEPLGTYTSTDITTACGALRACLNHILTQNPSIQIFVVLDHYGQWQSSSTNKNPYDQTQYEYNEELAKVCESMGIPVLKGYAISGMNEKTPYFFDDNIHLSRYGIKHFGNVVWDFMKKFTPKVKNNSL